MSTRINVNPPILQTPESGSCVLEAIRQQFARPTGRTGAMVGHLMALKNDRMNRFAAEILDVQPTDQVLEIGFGHGRTIGRLAERAVHGYVAGVDLSDVMVRQAARRNLDQILAGRVELCRGSVADLPFEYGRFTKVLAVNNYQFWPNAELNLTEVQRVMREDALLVLCLRLHSPRKFSIPGFTHEQLEETVGLLRWVGFHNITIEQRRLDRDVACVMARR
ncbi:MAG: class I SAM-dependent methyltransferase [Blastocatellia bacterium]|nr:class I SAM-dependent methyltransferase [Blastocatellia bacterium]